MDHDLSKELAKLSLSIQESRREIDALKVEKELFLEEREKEATARVLAALEQSKDAIKQTEDYVELIGRLQDETEAVVHELQTAKSLMQKERREFQARIEEARTTLEAKGKELEVSINEMKREKTKLEGLVESVRGERAMLGNEQTKINDDRGKLHAAFQIWRKQNGTITESQQPSLKTLVS